MSHNKRKHDTDDTTIIADGFLSNDNGLGEETRGYVDDAAPPRMVHKFRRLDCEINKLK